MERKFGQKYDVKVGMYIRTEHGISKVTYVNPKGTLSDNEEVYFVNQCFYPVVTTNLWESDLSYEPSYDILDVIEPGDIVNGRLVTKTRCNLEYIDDDSETGVNEINNGIEFEDGWIYFDSEVETVLTHDQYELMCYKVLDEKIEEAEKLCTIQ